MPIVVAPSESACMKALRGFLLDVLPSGIPVVQGQANRAGEPKDGDFAVFWPLRKPRLATNIDSSADVFFTASIAGDVMTVETVAVGTIVSGAAMFGTGLQAGSKIVAALSGTGGSGTYQVSPPQTLGSSPIASGATTIEQATELVVQIELHGPNSSDNAQIVSTLLRDDYGVQFFKNFPAAPDAVAPLYAEDPRQMQFINAQQQSESRWIVEAHLQANEVLSVPQQYADELSVPLYSVEAGNYPS